MRQPLLVRTDAIAAAPWRNGGGVTRELLALRARGSGWCVRVSVADVARDGPFSTFPGVERWFAVLDGAGVELTIDGAVRRVGRDDAALAFSGEAKTQCRLVDGPTRDLNLMLRDVDGALARVVPGAAWHPAMRACGLYAECAGTCAGMAIAPGTLCWWPHAPSTLAFDARGCWLSADIAPDADADAGAHGADADVDVETAAATHASRRAPS